MLYIFQTKQSIQYLLVNHVLPVFKQIIKPIPLEFLDFLTNILND